MRKWRFFGRGAILLLGITSASGAAPPAASPEPNQGIWISQVVLEPRIERSSSLVVHAFAQPSDSRKLSNAQWEIRAADEKQRVAIVSQPWEIPGNDPTAEANFQLSALTLPNGAYVMAWLVDDVRHSNVIRFEVGPGPATQASGEFLRIVQGEPRQPGASPPVELVAKRWAADYPDSVDLAWAELLVDGNPLTRRPSEQRGHGAPMLKVGESQIWRVRWEVWAEPPDFTRPHKLQVAYAESKSPEVKLLAGTPLGNGWDAATDKISGNGKVAGGAVGGTIIDAHGAPASGYRVNLLGGGKVYEEQSGVMGRFRFAGIPPGDYELTCEPRDKRVFAVVEKVHVDSGPVVRSVSCEGKFGVSGKVFESAEDGGGPAANRTVRATFISDDGLQTVEVSGQTGADGAFVVKGPYVKVNYVGVISSPEPTPVKDITAPREDVNFRLTGTQEEMRRVQ